MDVVRLYQDFGINHVTEGHKHSQHGWVNTPCPFCTGNAGYHLGWNIREEYYYCWRCGWHAPLLTIATILNITKGEAFNIMNQYGVNRTIIKQTSKKKQAFQLPSNIERLNQSARTYLTNKGFNASELKIKWKLKSLGPLSKLEEKDYRFRIFIPYHWNEQMVSFDSRDVTGKQEKKYKACPKNIELIERKRILYGNQNGWNTDLGICVEGPSDVWRLGDLAFAVSGISFTNAQVRLIAQIFKRVIIVFDSETKAQEQARKLRSELRLRGVTAEIRTIKGNDPGGLTQTEADNFIRSL